jgi:hypothetical protein
MLRQSAESFWTAKAKQNAEIRDRRCSRRGRSVVHTNPKFELSVVQIDVERLELDSKQLGGSYNLF